MITKATMFELLPPEIVGLIIRHIVQWPCQAWAAVPQVCRGWRAIWRCEILAAARSSRVCCPLPAPADILASAAATASFIVAAADCSCLVVNDAAAINDAAAQCHCGGRGECYAGYLGGSIGIPGGNIDMPDDNIDMSSGRNRYSLANIDDIDNFHYPAVPLHLFKRILDRCRINRDWFTQLVAHQPQLALEAWTWAEPDSGIGTWGIRFDKLGPKEFNEPAPTSMILYNLRPSHPHDVLASVKSLYDESRKLFNKTSNDQNSYNLLGLSVNTQAITDFSHIQTIAYDRFVKLSPANKRLLIFNQTAAYHSNEWIWGIFIILTVMHDDCHINGRANGPVNAEQTLSDDFITLIINAAAVKFSSRMYLLLRIIYEIDDRGGFGPSMTRRRIGRPTSTNPHWPLRLDEDGKPMLRLFHPYRDLHFSDYDNHYEGYQQLIDWCWRPDNSNIVAVDLAKNMEYLFVCCIHNIRTNHSHLIPDDVYNRLRNIADDIVGGVEWRKSERFEAANS